MGPRYRVSRWIRDGIGELREAEMAFLRGADRREGGSEDCPGTLGLRLGY